MTDKSKTVLIVDDDADFLLQEQVQLEAAGYQVVTAPSQADAEAWLAENTPDAAIVDLMLEHADGGFALCYHIKKKSKDIPVILVTAVANETGLEFDAATSEEKSWVKADVLLPKPVRFEQLKSELERMMK